MADPNFVLLYVDNPLSSAAFYTQLLGKAPVESAPTFVAFALESGVTLGLWSRHTAEPAVEAPVGGGELAFAVDDIDTLNALYADWTGRGIRVKQKPSTMDFGYTFVALDPDGHRLRVFCDAPARE